MYAEALTTSGTQELGVHRSKDGSIELEHVGDDTVGLDSGDLARAAKGPGECTDPAFTLNGWRVRSDFAYLFNARSTPRGLSPGAARRAVVGAGRNIVGMRSACRGGDRIPVSLKFRGGTRRTADRSDGACQNSDGVSVVSFGALPNRKTLAVTCAFYRFVTGYDNVTSSDVKINGSGFDWTTKPGARACKREWDLESVLTHERGHTFGLGHVLEKRHRKLTMSTIVNGPCQTAERTLGRGDIIGLSRKYR